METGKDAFADPTWEVRRRYFPAVEGMRGVAVLCVVIGHLLLVSYQDPPLSTLGIWMAPFGVVIFFAISGFLLYRQFLAARHAGEAVGRLTPSYLWRRAVRILPAYWVALTLGSLAAGWLGAFTGRWWIFYGLLQAYIPSDVGGGLPVAWSLCIEASFYLALPLIALALASRGLGSGNRNALRWELGGLGGLALAALLWRVWAATSGIEGLNVNLLGTFSWFALGMLLASLQVAHPASLASLRRVLADPRICWPVGALLFAGIWFEVASGPGAFDVLVQTLLYGFGAALLLAPAVLGDSGRLVRLALATRPMVFVGTISYGLYLWHFTVLSWVGQHTHITTTAKYPILTQAVVVIAISTVIAALSWYLLEKPLMRRAHSVKAYRHVKRGAIEVAEEDEPAPVAESAPRLPEAAPDVSG